MLQSNGTLVKVTGASSGEAYDGPVAAGPQKWIAAGDPTEIYLRERRDRNDATGDRTIDRVLLVDRELAVDWRSGDVVTWRRTTAAADETATVKLVERPEIDDPDIPDDLATVRLTLETA